VPVEPSHLAMAGFSEGTLAGLLDGEPLLKVSPSSTRSVFPAETERRIQRLLPLVPITRVADISRLDPLGFPVFVATTPRARDLTTHAGKGSDATSARVSALMEAIERVSAELLASELTIRESYCRLHGTAEAAVDPLLFELPKDTSYRPEVAFSWVPGRELLSDQPLWLPLDLAINPAQEGILREVDTNGLASGNTLLEAVIHGLCEVIERDALSQLEFTTLFGDADQVRPLVRSIAPETWPAEVSAWLERTASAGLTLLVQELATDLSVPTFRTVLVDPAYPTPQGPLAGYFPGFGSHPNKGVALSRSLGEALQSRVGFVHGGRDSFNVLLTGTRPAARQARHQTLFQAPRVSYGELPSFETLDLREDLRFLLARLEQAGLTRVIASCLTRRDWGVPVVRVRVPGLSCFLVNRRRVDRRCLRHLV